MTADREAAIRDMEPEDQWDALLAELAAAREEVEAMTIQYETHADRVTELTAREAKLREALREARPYVYGVASDPANALWRRQTAQGVLERCDAALADGEGET